MNPLNQMALLSASVCAVFIAFTIEALFRIEDPARLLVPLGWAVLAGAVVTVVLWATWARHLPLEPKNMTGPDANQPGPIVARRSLKGPISSALIGVLLGLAIAYTGGFILMGFFFPIQLGGAVFMRRRGIHASRLGYTQEVHGSPPPAG